MIRMANESVYSTFAAPNHASWRICCTIVLSCVFSSSAIANVGVFAGTGQDLRQITTEEIQMVSEDVTIIPGRGPFLYDGTVPGFDRVEYRCWFVLKNLTDRAVSIQVGFPLDSQFADKRAWRESSVFDWISAYSFIARDEKETYHVRQHWNEWNNRGALFIWDMCFLPNETKKLMVQYRLPMSMTLAATSKRGIDPEPPSTKIEWLNRLGWGVLEHAGYTTQTGSSWAGNVSVATFTILAKPFERCLDFRPLFENPASELIEQREKDLNRCFSNRHVWWYRDLKPDGWYEVRDGVQWTFRNFKPSDPISVRYYFTPFPRRADEVDSWIECLFNIEHAVDCNPEQIALVKEVLLATYAREPENADVKTFVQDQIWYSPRADFSLKRLSAEQRMILENLDRRIGQLRGPGADTSSIPSSSE